MLGRVCALEVSGAGRDAIGMSAAPDDAASGGVRPVQYKRDDPGRDDRSSGSGRRKLDSLARVC